MESPRNPVARKDGVVIQELPEEVLVYDLESNKAHCLNQTAAFVWRSCNGTNSIAEITSSFEKESGNRVDEDVVFLALEQLGERNLLEKESGPGLTGPSRRELIKKIGFATAVALPLIASLAAPTSVMAAGSCGCMSVGDCAAPCPTAGCSPLGTCT